MPLRLCYCLLAVAVVTVSPAFAQQSSQQELHSIPAIAFGADGPVLRRAVQAGEPITIAGPQGVVVGQQQGLLEAWVLPVKLLSHTTLEAAIEGYSVPLDLNSMARELEVHPDRTTIIYSHIAVTVRETIFAPDDAPEGTGAVVLFQVDSLRPVTLTLRFTPELREMWPKPSSGTPSAEWVARGDSGLYLLHTDFNNLAGAVALPGAKAGVMAPYQERPQVHPLELILHVDPKKDHGRMFPLLMAVGSTRETATSAALKATLNELNEHLPALYATHAERYRRQQNDLTSISTPDEDLNADLFWAETSISQLRARTRPSKSLPQGEVGLVAGYYASGDSARPGFGWYFGRDTLYTIYAIDSYGDFRLTRTALEFLMRRQRADGKVMHEYSQTAGDFDWGALPYQYAAADATPLMLTATLDYVRSSGDVEFLQQHRESLMKAWQFETTHDADGDGIYDNAQGTGWVESWPGGMPKQEVYLASLDEQASQAMAGLAALLGDDATSRAAAARASTVHNTLEREYYSSSADSYAFSRNDNASLDPTATVFPAIAWWSGTKGLDHPQGSLRHWASHDFDTDWGDRDVAESESIFDPTSYHQGSVWPLFTGWVALAEYRSNHPLAGYAATMQNADLTRAQDLGAVTELLSGSFFEPFGRSTSHQLWSSAMVITPLMRGLFGLDVDAIHRRLTVQPHLPADWPGAVVHNLRVGSSVVNVSYKRVRSTVVVSVQTVSGQKVLLANGAESASVPTPAAEVYMPHGLPVRGSRTAQPKVLDESFTSNALHLEIEGLAGSETSLKLVAHASPLRPRVEGAELDGDQLHIHFPAGTGYTTQTVTVRW